jgi:aminopeptidase N
MTFGIEPVVAADRTIPKFCPLRVSRPMRKNLTLSIALALSGAALANPADLPTTQLPREVRPLHYAVAITPHARELGFEGRVEIELEVLAPTPRIVLNALDMQFSSATLSAAKDKHATPAAHIELDARAQTASFDFGRELQPGTYTLALAYTGKIGTQANGLFAIDYSNDAGEQRALFTQFENSDARRFIPSWDEPAYKATFDLEATVPAAQMAVSNLPVSRRTELGNGLAKVKFGTSPKMSTYLLFFALGDFERATAMVDGTEVGVVAQRGAIDQAGFALQASKDVLKEYNDYFGMPYPLPKLDNIASPGSSQFFAAMENWGAIFTFEYAMLLNPQIASEGTKHGIFETAAHEIAHQWFGDLVTMSWWDDLWLNEGFASWMESRTTARLHPEWKTGLGKVGTRDRAMKRDSIATTHAVVQHVETVEQANQAFDSITYAKGEAIITMLEAYVGEDAWREGVRRYMKKHAYGNTVTDDLFGEVEAAAGKPIMKIAHQFTMQPGVPLVKVEGATCEHGRTTLSLRQGEFTVDRPDKVPLHWNVPVIAAVSGHAATRAVVDGDTSMTLDGCGAVVLNAGQTGYYRTLYSPAAFAALRGDFARLEPIDQLGVMADAWALGMAGEQPASDILDLIAVLPADAEPAVWGRAAGAFGTIDDMYKDDPARRARFRAFAVPRLRPQLERLGWTPRAGETDDVALLRSSMIGTLASLGDEATIAEAKRRVAAMRAGDKAAVPPALRRNLESIVAVNATPAEWEAIRAAARAEKVALIKDQYYGMLAYAQDPALARRALELALTDEPGATNTAGMISAVSGRFPEMAWEFAMAHMAQVDERVDFTSRSSYYPWLGASSGDAAMIGKIRAYADKYLDPGSRRSAETAMASIRNRIKVHAEQLPAIDAWLAKHGAAHRGGARTATR